MALNWTPTRLLLVVPSVERSIQETTKLGASGMVRNNAGLLTRWEYLPDVLFINTFAFNYDQYQGVDSNNSVTVEDRFKVVRAFTQQFHLGLMLEYQRRFSEADGSGFGQTKAGLTASVQY
jgi:hypothetical protein